VYVNFVLKPLFCVNILKQKDSENERSIHIIIYICVVLCFIISADLCIQFRAFTQNWHCTYFL
jgi:hypothetical protein